MNFVLIGNSFPWSLVRRNISVVPMTVPGFLQEIKNVELVSYWGHPDTLVEVSHLCGRDLTPNEERTALSLSKNLFPSLNGQTFDICYLVSPDYEQFFRPSLSSVVEKTPEIAGWTILKLIWEK